MRRALPLLLAAVAAALVAGLAVYLVLRPPPRRDPDTAALATQVREVARLEALEVSLYKKVSFAAEPRATDSVWMDLAEWAKHTLLPRRGRAVVFADATLGFDFSRFGPENLRVQGDRVDVLLPPLVVRVAVKPGETEVIDSNLDSQQTAALLEAAREGFQAQVEADTRLQERARRSAEATVRALLLSVGFREVRFVSALPRSRPG